MNKKTIITELLALIAMAGQAKKTIVWENPSVVVAGTGTWVCEGCFKYVTYGISDDKEHITWFSFEGEFAGDYPACLNGGPALTTIEAMVPTRIIRVSGEQLVKRFSQDKKSMDLRCLIAEHLLGQARARYTDLHRATPLERYELLLRRCPGIARHLPLNAIASFLCVTPQQLSRIRKAVTFSSIIE